MKKWIIFLLILLLGFFLRSGIFIHGDFIYLSDQARDLLLTKSFVVDHHLSLIGGRTGFGGLFHGAAWLYMISPFFFIFKGNPFWSLIPLFEVINLGIIATGFILTFKLYGKFMAFIVALFLAISAPLVWATPVTTNAEVLPIVVILYIFSIIKYLRGDEKFFPLSIFFIGLGFQFESAFSVLLIPLTGFAIIIRRKIPSLKNWILGFFGFLLSVSTFILFDLRHNFLMTSAAIRLFTNTNKPLPGYEEYSNILFRAVDRIINLWNSFFSPLYSKDSIVSALLVLIILAALFILVKRIYKKEVSVFEKEALFVFSSPFIIFGIYIIYPFPLWPHYLLPISVISVFILALSIKIIWEKPILKPLILIFLGLALVSPVLSISSYLSLQNYIPTSDSSYKNQLEVASFVVNDSANKHSSYFVYTPGVLTYSMDYLIAYLAEKKQIPVPENSKTEDTYLIFYPPLSGDTGAYDFWKKNVIKTTARPYSSKTFKGGITVEKIDLSSDKEAVDPNYFQNLIFR